MSTTHPIVATIRDHLNEGRFLDACRVAADIEDDAIYAQVDAAFPSLIDYDRNGNYVGAAANENGWTA